MSFFILRALPSAIAALLLSASQLTMAQETDFSGQIRGLWNTSSANTSSPAGMVNQLVPGLIAHDTQSGVAEAELHLSGKGITAIATLQGQMNDSGNTRASGWLNELYAAGGEGAWQYSAGKRVIAWDVGYGFRPNDVVAQEKRRSLISTTSIGKPLASVEYFNASSSVSMVWVNPGHAPSTDMAEEQAFAARVYHRMGSLDLHGFARYGQENGASLGAAAAWVATDEMELHASLRYLRKNTGLRMSTDSSALSNLIQRNSPWQDASQNNAMQVMLGANYTTESQHSFFLETWWDGTAMSDRQWQDWTTRNQSLRGSIAYLPQLQKEIGYNLAWQNQALSTSGNLRRKNVFVRWSWQDNGWQPAIDLLWTPEDNGRITTASLGWQGDRITINGGIRIYGGPNKAVMAQLPDSKTAYISATWAF
ncbi:hypothetical protein [Undibacterium sp. TJN19]|uniref:hypothetical protein n=1 Tax=Undibacterium sp. TJN19 TaxID=3413055 RepID=UPI003BF12CF3